MLKMRKEFKSIYLWRHFLDKRKNKAIELSKDSSKRALGYLKSMGLSRHGADHPVYSPRDQFTGRG